MDHSTAKPDNDRRSANRQPVASGVTCLLDFAGIQHLFVVDEASPDGLRLRTEVMWIFDRMAVGATAHVLSVSRTPPPAENDVAATPETPPEPGRFPVEATIVWVAALKDRVLAGLQLSPPLRPELLRALALPATEL